MKGPPQNEPAAVANEANASSGTPGKWWVCGLLLLATVLTYLDRQVLSLTAEMIIDEFDLSKEGFGSILSAFRYSYAAVQLGGGWLVDSLGARAIYPLAVGTWSLAAVLSGFASSATGFSATRFMLGIGEAFNWPCALKVTERLLPPKDRPLANGIFNSGTALGSMIAPVLVTFLALRYGWRSVFYITGALGAFWIIGWLRYTRPRAEKLKGDRLAPIEAVRVMWSIVTKANFWALSVSALIINSVSYYLADWIPLYLKTERGFSFAEGNALSVLIYMGLDGGNLLVGLYVRQRISAGASLSTARKSALRLSCILMSTAFIAGSTDSRSLAVICLVLTAVGVASFLVIYLTLVQDLDPAHVGSSAGLLGGLGNLSYGLVSPYIGRLADLGRTRLIFAMVGLMPWLAYASISAGMKREEK